MVVQSCAFLAALAGNIGQQFGAFRDVLVYNTMSSRWAVILFLFSVIGKLKINTLVHSSC